MAAESLPPLPPEVAAERTKDAETCTKTGGAFTLSNSVPYVLTADFNGDGRTDYVLDETALQCSTLASLYCGSAGCGVTVFLSQASGRYARAAELISPQTKIVRHNGRPCLDAGGRIWGWDGKAFRLLR